MSVPACIRICAVCVVHLADIKFGDLGRKTDWQMCSLADKLESLDMVATTELALQTHYDNKGENI